MNREDMILRDHLALDRTKLANERTLLAYVRTAVMLFVSGLSFVKIFYGSALFVTVGGILTAASVLTAAIGTTRFRTVQKRMHGHYNGPKADPDDTDLP